MRCNHSILRIFSDQIKSTNFINLLHHLNENSVKPKGEFLITNKKAGRKISGS